MRCMIIWTAEDSGNMCGGRFYRCVHVYGIYRAGTGAGIDELCTIAQCT